jgi:hypothetical protein
MLLSTVTPFHVIANCVSAALCKMYFQECLGLFVRFYLEEGLYS